MSHHDGATQRAARSARTRRAAPIAEFVARPPHDCGSPEELCRRVLLDLSAGTFFSDGVLFDLFRRSDDTGAIARSVFSAYLLRYVLSYVPSELRRPPCTYFPCWSSEEVASVVLTSAQASRANAMAAIDLTSWNPGESAAKVGLDLGTTPYVKLPNAMIGAVVVPGVNISVFAETRRTLAATNRLSADVGRSYEEYVRQLFAEGGFKVCPRSVVIRSNDRAITDVDVLAYKSGMLVVCQTKHIIEPESHHANWKARHEISCGVRQCMQAFGFFQEEPERVFEHFPEARADGIFDTCCLVVTPAICFGGESHWPVAIVDDAYLQHVISIGEVRTFDAATGAVIDSRRLYEGPHPSGKEFKELMVHPEFLNHYRGSPVLVSQIKSVGSAHFVRFAAVELTP